MNTTDEDTATDNNYRHGEHDLMGSGKFNLTAPFTTSYMGHRLGFLRWWLLVKCYLGQVC